MAVKEKNEGGREGEKIEEEKNRWGDRQRDMLGGMGEEGKQLIKEE